MLSDRPWALGLGGEESFAQGSGQGFNMCRVRRLGFQVLLEFACDACAFVKAEHPDRAGEFVGYGCGFLLQRRGQGLRCGLVQQGKAFQDLGLIALPEGGDHFLHRSLCVVCHGLDTEEIVNSSELAETYLLRCGQ